jgi:undecaprenyl-diphosphatase
MTANAGVGANVDRTVTAWINAGAGGQGPLDALMVAASAYGVPLLIALVVIQWWGRSARDHVRHVCIGAGLSFLIGLGLNQIILLVVHRIRPYDAGVSHLIVPPSPDWSFPSDHATAALSIAATFAMHRLNGRAAFLIVLALIVCWSRIYIGIHFASDVLGGALTGLIAAVAVRAGYREGTRLDRLVTGIL